MLNDEQVDGKLFAEAVELANAKKKSIVDVSSAGTKSLLQKEPSQLIKFKTRLNGKHEWKWKLPSQHTFKMVRFLPFELLIELRSFRCCSFANIILKFMDLNRRIISLSSTEIRLKIQQHQSH